jgi:hypothetical protein
MGDNSVIHLAQDKGVDLMEIHVLVDPIGDRRIRIVDDVSSALVESTMTEHVPILVVHTMTE